MKKTTKKAKTDKRNPRQKSKPKKRIFFNDFQESGYLREVLGHTDVALWIDQTPLFGRADPNERVVGDLRVTFQPELTDEEDRDDEGVDGASSGDAAMRQKNSSRRFKRFWATLTLAQKEALRLIYINNPKNLSKVEVAELLGIRVDTLQERIDYAVKKLKRYFPDFTK